MWSADVHIAVTVLSYRWFIEFVCPFVRCPTHNNIIDWLLLFICFTSINGCCALMWTETGMSLTVLCSATRRIALQRPKDFLEGTAPISINVDADGKRNDVIRTSLLFLSSLFFRFPEFYSTRSNHWQSETNEKIKLNNCFWLPLDAVRCTNINCTNMT